MRSMIVEARIRTTKAPTRMALIQGEMIGALPNSAAQTLDSQKVLRQWIRAGRERCSADAAISCAPSPNDRETRLNPSPKWKNSM